MLSFITGFTPTQSLCGCKASDTKIVTNQLNQDKINFIIVYNSVYMVTAG